MPGMSASQKTETKAVDSQVENKSLAPAEDKAAKSATEEKSDDKVTFVIAHPLPKSLFVADADGEHAPGDKVQVDAHVAASLAAQGAGRLAE